jgi:lipopolysaccharide/colanic/teichoic acid biosynthesis glycosyltransferase
MIAAKESPRITTRVVEPKLWGLTPTELHDRYWAQQGICVVRRGEIVDFDHAPRVYLLTDTRSLVLFKLPMPASLLIWTGPKLGVARVYHDEDNGVRETVRTNPDRSFLRIERTRERAKTHLTRVAITTSRELAEQWQASGDLTRAWRHVRAELAPRKTGFPKIVFGQAFNRKDSHQFDAFARSLLRYWQTPGGAIQGIERMNSEVWKPVTSGISDSATIIGSVWIGAGRIIPSDAVIAGPAVLWDDPHLPGEDNPPFAPPPRLNGPRRLRANSWVDRPVVLRRRSRAERAVKRVFDFFFALLAVILTLPFYPFVMAAIWLEDGRPFFFKHRRETMRGREFNCWKFRSMRKDAEMLKVHIRHRNVSNGPHFYMPDDPRLTGVGRFIRRFHIDELPQFFNVLTGHMSLVGPRPSPHCENQGNTIWREARLSVRPGITGLWQVMRTREEGTDFQEWVRFDMQYVENGSFWMDLRIILRTLKVVVYPK